MTIKTRQYKQSVIEMTKNDNDKVINEMTKNDNKDKINK